MKRIDSTTELYRKAQKEPPKMQTRREENKEQPPSPKNNNKGPPPKKKRPKTTIETPARLKGTNQMWKKATSLQERNNQSLGNSSL